MKKKIKIIDLLNKIANDEEVPKKIKYKGLMYYQDGRGYFHDETEYTTERAFLEGVRTDMVLNDVVEILDKENEFEDIEEMKDRLCLDYKEITPIEKATRNQVNENRDMIMQLIKNQKKIIERLSNERN